MNDEPRMLRPDEVFPARFWLRSDFAIEMGYTDDQREPLSEAAYATYCREKLRMPFSWEGYRAANAHRAGYALPRYVGYCFLIPRGQTASYPYIYDGVTWKRIEKEGLCGDFVRRVAAATGIEDESRLPIMPIFELNEKDRCQYPLSMALHDRATSVVTLVPFAAARTLLEPGPVGKGPSS